MRTPVSDAPGVTRNNQDFAAQICQTTQIVVGQARDLHLDIQLPGEIEDRSVVMQAVINRGREYLHGRPAAVYKSLEYFEVTICGGDCKTH